MFTSNSSMLSDSKFECCSGDENFQIDCHSSSSGKYEIIRRVGTGRNSTVFEGLNTLSNEKCIIKVYSDSIKQKKLKREIKILHNLNGGINIMKLLDIVRDSDSNRFSLILEHYENSTDLGQLCGMLTENDVKFYMCELLKSIDFCHSMGIMHRNIKPKNVMIDHKNKKLGLIGWGLAEFYYPEHEYNVRLGNRYFKSPELLLSYGKYDYSIDMWNLGCVFARMIFGKDIFSHGRDNYDQLVKLAKVLGSEELFEYTKRYSITIPDHLNQIFNTRNTFSRKPLSSFVNEGNAHLANEQAIDFLDKLLCYDHKERMTAKEALQHAFIGTHSGGQ